jgi:mannose-6-phosphate isomerase-like protein (cupin superfamily)
MRIFGASVGFFISTATVVTSLLASSCGGARTEPAGTSVTAAEAPRAAATATALPPTMGEMTVPGLTPKGWQPGTVGASVTVPVFVQREKLKWVAAPPILTPGATMAVLEGDPNAAGKLFTVRLRTPDGYRISPHWHFSDEHVTIISGTIRLGMGDEFDTTKMETVTAGGYAALPARHHHYALTQGETEIQLHSVGPWKLIYVNPTDDPSRQQVSQGP